MKYPKGKATGEYLLVQKETLERKTKGGIYIPEKEGRRRDLAAEVGTILSLGPLAFQDEKAFEKEFGVEVPIPKVGDRVGIARHGGLRTIINGEEFWLYRHTDITFIFDKDDQTQVEV